MDEGAAETTIEIPNLSRVRVRNSAYIKRRSILMGLATMGASKEHAKLVKERSNMLPLMGSGQMMSPHVKSHSNNPSWLIKGPESGTTVHFPHLFLPLLPTFPKNLQMSTQPVLV